MMAATLVTTFQRKGELLALIVLPTVSEKWESAANLVSLQRKTHQFLFLFPFVFIGFSNQLLGAKILFAKISSPLSLLNSVVKEPKVPIARPISVKQKKLVGNRSYTMYLLSSLMLQLCLHDNPYSYES